MNLQPYNMLLLAFLKGFASLWYITLSVMVASSDPVEVTKTTNVVTWNITWACKSYRVGVQWLHLQPWTTRTTCYSNFGGMHQKKNVAFWLIEKEFAPVSHRLDLQVGTFLAWWLVHVDAPWSSAASCCKSSLAITVTFFRCDGAQCDFMGLPAFSNLNGARPTFKNKELVKSCLIAMKNAAWQQSNLSIWGW